LEASSLAEHLCSVISPIAEADMRSAVDRFGVAGRDSKVQLVLARLFTHSMPDRIVI